MQIGLLGDTPNDLPVSDVVTVTPTTNIYTDPTTGQVQVHVVQQPQSNSTGLLVLGAAVVFAFLMAK